MLKTQNCNTALSLGSDLSKFFMFYSYTHNSYIGYPLQHLYFVVWRRGDPRPLG